MLPGEDSRLCQKPQQVGSEKRHGTERTVQATGQSGQTSGEWWKQRYGLQRESKIGEQALHLVPGHAPDMLVERIVGSEVIPENDTSRSQDSVDFTADVDLHLGIQNRGEHSEDCNQVE